MGRWGLACVDALGIAGLITAMIMAATPVLAGSLTGKDVQIITKLLGFLDPPSVSGVVAVVYTAGDAASKADALEVADLFGVRFKAGSSTIRAEPVAAEALGHGTRYVAVILAAGTSIDAVAQAIRFDRALCITSDIAQVQAGKCVIAVRSDPRVDIVLNRDLAASAGIGFATAFRMLVHEI